MCTVSEGLQVFNLRPTPQNRGKLISTHTAELLFSIKRVQAGVVEIQALWNHFESSSPIRSLEGKEIKFLLSESEGLQIQYRNKDGCFIYPIAKTMSIAGLLLGINNLEHALSFIREMKFQISDGGLLSGSIRVRGGNPSSLEAKAKEVVNQAGNLLNLESSDYKSDLKKLGEPLSLLIKMIKEELSDIERKIKESESRSVELVNSICSLKSQLATIRKNAKHKTSEVEALSSTIRELESERNKLNERIFHLEVKIRIENEGPFSFLRKLFRIHNPLKDNLERRLGEKEEEHKQVVKRKEESFNQQEKLEGEIKELEKKIKETEISFKNLTDSLKKFAFVEEKLNKLYIKLCDVKSHYDVCLRLVRLKGGTSKETVSSIVKQVKSLESQLNDASSALKTIAH